MDNIDKVLPEAEQAHTLCPTKKREHYLAKKKKKRNNQKKKKFLMKLAKTNKPILPGKSNMAHLRSQYCNTLNWPTKHQVAYWKSKAMSLQYENQVLHNIVRKYALQNAIKPSQASESSSDESDQEQFVRKRVPSHGLRDPPQDVIPSNFEQDGRQQNEVVEVSEAWIEFLMQNEKYRQEAQKEKERIKNDSHDSEQEVIKMEAPPTKQCPLERECDMKTLYGEDWKKISAIETAVQMKFDHFCDENKPVYWPYLPLKIMFSH